MVLITASSEDSAPLLLAAEIARDRGKVVAVGATPLDVPRRLFYAKELSLIVSRSYGPGRYDPNFEERGQDYPIGYVRWTERANMSAFLELVADGRVRVEALITHRMPIGQAVQAYELLDDPDTLGIVLQYPEARGTALAERATSRIELREGRIAADGQVAVSIVGAGNFAQAMLLPALKRVSHVHRRGVVTASGLTSRSVGDRFAFDFCSSDAAEVWNDPRTDAVVIATRNHLHAPLVAAALAAGKAVFVEKPMAVSQDQLTERSVAPSASTIVSMPELFLRIAGSPIQSKEAGASSARSAISSIWSHFWLGRNQRRSRLNVEGLGTMSW
jgi:hypothetical protein